MQNIRYFLVCRQMWYDYFNTKIKTRGICHGSWINRKNRRSHRRQQGIGYAAAGGILKEGAKVAICARHEEELKEAAKPSQYGPVNTHEAFDVVVM